MWDCEQNHRFPVFIYHSKFVISSYDIPERSCTSQFWLKMHGTQRMPHYSRSSWDFYNSGFKVNLHGICWEGCRPWCERQANYGIERAHEPPSYHQTKSSRAQRRKRRVQPQLSTTLHGAPSDAPTLVGVFVLHISRQESSTFQIVWNTNGRYTTRLRLPFLQRVKIDWAQRAYATAEDSIAGDETRGGCKVQTSLHFRRWQILKRPKIFQDNRLRGNDSNHIRR